MQDIKELSKKLRERPEFADFQEYIILKINELDSVKHLNTLSNEQAGETAKARLLAIKTLEEILRPFIDFAEKHEYTEEEIKEAAARRGL